jgi:hypothetical protein
MDYPLVQGMGIRLMELSILIVTPQSGELGTIIPSTNSINHFYGCLEVSKKK